MTIKVTKDVNPTKINSFRNTKQNKMDVSKKIFCLSNKICQNTNWMSIFYATSGTVVLEKSHLVNTKSDLLKATIK